MTDVVSSDSVLAASLSSALSDAELIRLRAENDLLRAANKGLEADLFLALKSAAVEQETFEAKKREALSTQRAEFHAEIAERRRAFDSLKQLYLDAVARLEAVKTASAAAIADAQARAAAAEAELRTHASRAAVDDMRKTAEKQFTATIQGEGPLSGFLCTGVPVTLQIRGPFSATDRRGDVHWFRTSGGSVYTPIYGVGGTGVIEGGVPAGDLTPFRYTPTADDIGCTLRAQFVDSTTAACLASEIGPVIPHPDLVESAAEVLRKAEVEYTVAVADLELIEATRTLGFGAEAVELGKDVARTRASGAHYDVRSQQTLTVGRKRVKISKGRRTHLKTTFDENISVEPVRDSETAFVFAPQGRGGPTITCEAASRSHRDTVLTALRLCGQLHMLETALASRGKSTRQDAIERECAVLYIMAKMTTSTPCPEPAFVANSKLLSGVQDLLAQAAQAVEVTAPVQHVAQLIQDDSRYGGLGGGGPPPPLATPGAGADGRRGSLSVSTSRGGGGGAGSRGGAAAAGGMGAEYAPADIDDITRGATAGGNADPNARGFGDLVPKNAAWDSDSDDDAPAGRGRPGAAAATAAGAGAGAGAGVGGSGHSTASGSGAGDEEEAEATRGPAIRVMIKPKSEAATVSAAEFAAFRVSGFDGDAPVAAVGGQVVGRRRKASVASSAASSAAPTPTASSGLSIPGSTRGAGGRFGRPVPSPRARPPMVSATLHEAPGEPDDDEINHGDSG